MHNLNHTLIKRATSFAAILATLLFIGCGGGSSTPAPPPTGTTPQMLNVTINWAANNETNVNQAGGGYNIYISQNSGFNIGDAGVTMVTEPYTSTSTIQPLSSGTYYVRVAAFSPIPAANTESEASAQITVTVPFTLP